MSKSLNELRSRWEASSEVVTEWVTDNFVVSVNRVGSVYWVYRYFKMLSGDWMVSADMSNGSADAALRAYTKALALAY